MRLLGQLEQGVYVDDLEDVPLEDLHQEKLKLLISINICYFALFPI